MLKYLTQMICSAFCLRTPRYQVRSLERNTSSDSLEKRQCESLPSKCSKTFATGNKVQVRIGLLRKPALDHADNSLSASISDDLAHHLRDVRLDRLVNVDFNHI